MTVALSSLWHLLGVKNQTEAMQRLHSLLAAQYDIPPTIGDGAEVL
jgi:hypothetical protein